jgi:hypothetical protein
MNKFTFHMQTRQKFALKRLLDGGHGYSNGSSGCSFKLKYLHTIYFLMIQRAIVSGQAFERNIQDKQRHTNSSPHCNIEERHEQCSSQCTLEYTVMASVTTFGFGIISICKASASTSLLIAFKFTHLQKWNV